MSKLNYFLNVVGVILCIISVSGRHYTKRDRIFSLRSSREGAASASIAKSPLQTTVQKSALQLLVEPVVSHSLVTESLRTRHDRSQDSDENIVFVITVDGRYHLVSQNRLEWSSESADPTVYAYDDRAGGSEANVDHKRVIPDTDGSLLLYTQEGMHRTNLKAADLADNAPFISEDGIVFTSEKSSRVIRVDLANGNVRDYSKSKQKTSSQSDVCESPFFLSRVDHLVSGVDIVTGEVFQMAFSDIEPLLSSATRKSSVEEEVSRLAAVQTPSRQTRGRRESSEVKDSLFSSVFELHTSPNGDVRFVDELGDALTDLSDSLNLGSLVKSAFVLQRPSALRSGTPKFKALHVVRRMNSGDEPVHQEGTVLVQSCNSPLVGEGDKGGRGVFAIEIPFVESDSERLDREAQARRASLRPEDSMYLCPPIGAGNLASSKDHDLCVQQSVSSDEEDTTADFDSELEYLPMQPLSTLHLMPPKAVTMTVGASRIGSSIKQTSTTPPHYDRMSPRDRSDRDNKSKSRTSSPIKVVPVLSVKHQPTSELCVSQAVSFADLFNTCPNVECVAAHNRSTAAVALKPSDFSASVPVTDPVVSLYPSDIRGEYKLLPNVFEGRIFGALRLDSEGADTTPEMGLSTKVTRITPLWRFVLSVEKMTESRWFVPILLVVFVFIVAAIGPNNYVLATVLDWLLGKTAAKLQANAIAAAMLQRQQSVLMVPATPPRHDAFLVAQTPQPPLTSAPATPFADAVVMAADVQEVDDCGRKVTRIGSLVVYAESILGYGSHGTVVFRGGLNGRPVAVKRMLSHCRKSADREISLLIRSDGHPNVVRYFLQEQKSDFLYLALQLCEMSLRDFVQALKANSSLLPVDSSSDGKSNQQARKAEAISDPIRRSLLQIAEGVTHLHSHRIVHRDIKPHNILCALVSEADLSSNEGGALSTGSLRSLDQLGEFVLKISDMGLSKQLDRHETSFSSMSFSLNMSVGALVRSASRGVDGAGEDHLNAQYLEHLNSPVGTIGWQAPELLGGRRHALSTIPQSSEPSHSSSQLTGAPLFEGEEEEDEEPLEVAEEEDEESSDRLLGALGESLKGSRSIGVPILSSSRLNRKRTQTVDIFLSVGGHPFGENYERESNIISNRMDLSALQHAPDAVDLISWMLQSDPLQRPSGAEVCGHPFFWPSSKRLEFLVEFSDRLEQEPADAPIILAVESNAASVVSSRWDTRLDGGLLEDMGKYRKYDTSSTRDLLRVVRNKRHHYHELSPAVKAAVGSLEVGFFAYFDLRFPKLLLHCVRVAERFLSTDRLFAQWFQKHKKGSKAAATFVVEAVTNSLVAVGEKGLTVASSAVHSIISDSVREGDPLELSSESAEVVVWHGSSLATTLKCNGWWREQAIWVEGGQSAVSGGSSSKKTRPNHMTTALQDPRFRTNLCAHWEENGGATGCPMRKKGKCNFAHGPLELRVKDTGKRSRWGAGSSRPLSDEMSCRVSGGEDVLGAARGFSARPNAPSVSHQVVPVDASSVKGSGLSFQAVPSPSSHSQSSISVPNVRHNGGDRSFAPPGLQPRQQMQFNGHSPLSENNGGFSSYPNQTSSPQQRQSSVHADMLRSSSNHEGHSPVYNTQQQYQYQLYLQQQQQQLQQRQFQHHQSFQQQQQRSSHHAPPQSQQRQSDDGQSQTYSQQQDNGYYR